MYVENVVTLSCIPFTCPVEYIHSIVEHCQYCRHDSCTYRRESESTVTSFRQQPSQPQQQDHRHIERTPTTRMSDKRSIPSFRYAQNRRITRNRCPTMLWTVAMFVLFCFISIQPTVINCQNVNSLISSNSSLTLSSTPLPNLSISANTIEQDYYETPTPSTPASTNEALSSTPLPNVSTGVNTTEQYHNETSTPSTPTSTNETLSTPLPNVSTGANTTEQHHNETSTPASTNKTLAPIKIGYLTNLYGRHSSTRQGLVISGAISYAIARVNDEHILGDRQLQLLFNDTSATSLNGTAALISQWKAGAVAFFGPEDTCEVEGTLAGAINLPMISYKCASAEVSNKANYPTFIRTQPTEPMVVRSVLALLRHYSWLKFAVVWSKRQADKYEPVISALKAEAERLSANRDENSKFKITVEYPFEDHFECCILARDCCGKIWQNLVQSTYRETRIYIFFGGGSVLPYFLLQLKTSGLLDHGEYMVISVDLEEDYSENQSYRYVNQRTDLLDHELDAIYEASRSLLVIAKNNPQAENWNIFEEKVQHYNKLPPFNLKDSFKYKRYITFYAAYLYDAVMIYANGLKKTLADGFTEHDGREIVKRIIDQRRFKSIIGNYMHIDTNGDVQGNFSVLQPNVRSSFRPTGRDLDNKSDDTEPNPISAMNHVGSFYIDDSTNETKYSVTSEIVWFKPGHVPLDEPECGFDGKKCDKMDLPLQQILSVALSVCLIATVFLSFFIYRNWKYEQEIDGLLWKISQEDIVFDEDRHRALNSSRISLISNASYTQMRMAMNGDSATTKMATYKGAIVAVKELRFAKTKKYSSSLVFDNLTREHKKEMKYMKEMHQKNINPFIGACSHPNYPDSVFIVREYCSKGSLRDILENHEIKCQEEVLSSLIHDILSALHYLHKGEIRCHGNLKSSNCLISSRWTLKLCDFGLHQLRAAAEIDSSSCYRSHYNSLWKSPEILRGTKKGLVASPEADIYAFGIIMHEMLVRKGPFSLRDMVEDDQDLEEQYAKKVVELVRQETKSDGIPHRPDIQGLELNNEILEIMTSCWKECPKERPTVDTLRLRFKTSRLRPPSGNFVDNMMKMMEIYSNQLEVLVDKRTQQLDDEKRKVEHLLHRMLPVTVAKQLLQGEEVQPETFDSVTIFFSDIVGFTSLSAESTPMEVVAFLNDLYTLFDSIISNYDVYKVETIGDAYMVVSGLPIRNEDRHSQEIASMALEMLEAIKHFQIRHRPNEVLQLRIGLHTGSVVSGVVGRKMPRYCLFGDTVNTASRMESNGEALKIHISPECRDHLQPSNKYVIEERGLLKIKGKGEIRTYWLTGHIDGPQPRMKAIDRENPFANSVLGPAKFKPHISFLGDDTSNDFLSGTTSRKGSLIAGTAQANTKKVSGNGRNMIQASLMKLKGLSHSNSCSSFGPDNGRNVGLSPRTGKRNWGAFRLFNGKARSASTKEATEDRDVHALTVHGGNPSQNIRTRLQTDQTRLPKGIIKSPSYNAIENFNCFHPRDRVYQMGNAEPEELVHLNDMGMGVLDIKFDFNQHSPINTVVHNPMPYGNYSQQQNQQQESSLNDSEYDEQSRPLLCHKSSVKPANNAGLFSAYTQAQQQRQKGQIRKNSLAEEEEEYEDDDYYGSDGQQEHVSVDVHNDENDDDAFHSSDKPLLSSKRPQTGNGQLSILVDASEDEDDDDNTHNNGDDTGTTNDSTNGDNNICFNDTTNNGNSANNGPFKRPLKMV